MIKRKISSVVIAGLMAFSVVAGSMATNFPTSINASAQMLGQTDFNEGIGLPWHTCENTAGKLDFEIDNGVYTIEIINPGGASRGGEDRWDVQFRHRGLNIIAGHQYKVSWEITASNSGQYYTKIGNMDGTEEYWNNNWQMRPLTAGQKSVVSETFTAETTNKISEWAFHLGGSGPYTPQDCFPPGTIITFDNMSLIDLTDPSNKYVHEDPYIRKEVLVNQVGYYPSLKKQATVVVKEGESAALDFELKDATGTVAYSGKTSGYRFDPDSGDYVQIIDFTEFDVPGTDYQLFVGDKESYTFNIGDWVYDGLLRDSLNYFYQNRSAMAIESKYITSGDANSLARAAGHTSDIATPIAFVNPDTGSKYGIVTGSSVDTTGGWYDAGDHGKYVVNGGISAWTMQNQYERALVNGFADKYADGKLSIPENSNGYPDLLDEARYQMEFMLKMQIKSGTYSGLVYHKVHDVKWTALAISPADATAEMDRVILPPTTQATLNLAATAAQSYRLWKDIDSTFADECLAAAKSAYTAAKAYPNEYAPFENIAGGGGPYGDDDATDEFYWAACELYIATGDEAYKSDMNASEFNLAMLSSLDGGEDEGSIGSFNWGNVSSLGTLSLFLNPDVLSEAEVATIEKNIAATGDKFLELEDKQGYGLPFAASKMNLGLDFDGYIWGSNSFVVNNAISLAYAYDATGETKYLSGVTTAMDYIMGRNPMDNSYVTGYGTNAIKNPHHRWWSGQIDSSFPLAPAGVLSGGPNSAMQDPWIKGAGYKVGTKEPQLCYLDHVEAWSVNECTINWNVALAWVAGYMEDEAPLADATGTETTTETTTSETTTETTTSETTTVTTTSETTTVTEPDVDWSKVLYGDVDVDGAVRVNDVIEFNKFLVDAVVLSPTARENANCIYDDMLNMADNMHIAKYLVKQITQDDLGPQN